MERPKTTRKTTRRTPAKTDDMFDWRTVPDVDPDELALWMARTDATERQFPLQLALQVHDELERKLMSPAPMDSMQLAEIRGALKALARFAQVYDATLHPRQQRQAAGK